MSQTKAQLISDLVQALNFTGTASAPANGLFLSATNTLQLSTASTSRLTINSDGHVDVVGNLDVGAGLDVTGAITATGDVTISNELPTIALTDTGANPDYELRNENGEFRVRDTTSGVNRMRITSGGTVDVAGNLDVGAGLDVTGNITATGDINLLNNGTLFGGDDASNTLILRSTSGNSNHSRIDVGVSEGSDNGGLHFYTAGSSVATRAMTIKGTSQNVGIGTTSPDASLDIGGNTDNNIQAIMTRASDPDFQIQFRNESSSNNAGEPQGKLGLFHGSNDIAGFQFNRGGSTGAGSLSFTTGGTERMSLSASSLSFAGTKNGNAYEDATLRFNIVNSSGDEKKAQIISTKVADISSTIEFGTTVSHSYAERMRIHSDGNVGIGTTSPDRKFQVTEATSNRVVNITTGGSSGAFLAFLDSNTTDDSKCRIGTKGGNHLSLRGDSHSFQDGAGSDKVHIDSSGRVGIGMSNHNSYNSVADDLIIAQESGHCGITIRSGTTHLGGIFFTDVADTGFRGGVRYDHNGDYMRIDTNLAERMRIDSSGRVLIGTTSGSDALVVDGGSDAGTITTNSTNSNGNMMTFNCSGTGKFFIGSAGSFITGNSGTTNQGIRAEGSLLFAAGGHTERMRIDSSGNVLIGVNTTGSTSEGMTIRPGNESTLFRDSGFVFLIGGGQSGQRLIDFRQGGTSIGHISKSGTTNVSYSTSSDYRLKENVVAISDGITRLKTLKPYRFNFKADADRTVDGFFAHEVTAVPEAIAGTKDEVDSDNNPVYQGIDHSKLVPLLVAAVQELITKVETLEAA